MALESPLKKDAEKASREIDSLNRIYNVYFQGGEEDPPRAQRAALEALINKIKVAVNTTNSATDRFLVNSVVSRYQAISGKWDKTLRGIEAGTINRPKKRS